MSTWQKMRKFYAKQLSNKVKQVMAKNYKALTTDAKLGHPTSASNSQQGAPARQSGLKSELHKPNLSEQDPLSDDQNLLTEEQNATHQMDPSSLQLETASINSSKPANQLNRSIGKLGTTADHPALPAAAVKLATEPPNIGLKAVTFTLRELKKCEYMPQLDELVTM